MNSSISKLIHELFKKETSISDKVIDIQNALIPTGEVTEQIKNPESSLSLDALVAEVFGTAPKIQFNNECSLPNTRFEEFDMKAFDETSANCVHKVFGDTFIKIQLYALTDPLINEVIINKVLNGRKNSTNVFSQYLSHNLIVPTHNPQKKYQMLKTKALPIGFQPLFEFMQSNDPNTVLKVVHIFLEEYTQIARSIGFVHNDMHLNNVIAVEENSAWRIKLIDYGRSFIGDIGKNPENYKKLLQESFDGFCIASQNQKQTYSSIILEDGQLNRFSIRDGGLGYMCDVSTLVLNLLVSYKNMKIVDWFKIEAGKIYIGVPTISIDNDNWFVHGLAFMAIFLRLCFFQNDDKDVDIFVNKDVHIPLDDVYGKYLGTNGVFKPSQYMNHMYAIHEAYSRIAKNSSGGKRRQGGNINTKTFNFINVQEMATPTPNLGMPSKWWSVYDALQTYYELHKLNTTQITRVNTQSTGITVGSQGGNSQQSYKLHVERKTNRTYALIGKSKFYLDSNRGKYIYSNKDKTMITLRSKSK